MQNIIHDQRINISILMLNNPHTYLWQTSGGPLIIPGSKASQDTLVGVTSWGVGCATSVFPGVFARVSKAFDWISETVCEESMNPPSYLCVTSEPTAKPTDEPTPEVSVISYTKNNKLFV